MRNTGAGVDEADVYRVFGGCVSAYGRSLGRLQIPAATLGTKRLPSPSKSTAFSLPPSGSAQIFGCSGGFRSGMRRCGMCGIVGYAGRERCVQVLMEGLRNLEYRGYDSAGLALALPEAGGIETTKEVGPLDNLTSAIGRRNGDFFKVRA